jgi:hypothetical protein
MWQYAVTRTIAETNGYDFALDGKFLGEKLFDCDLGRKFNPATVKHRFKEPYRQEYIPELIRVQDGTKLNGFFQCENYIRHNKRNILNWFRFKEDYSDLLDGLEGIIQFRGTDYKKGFYGGAFYLPKSYYDFCLNRMQRLYGNIRYIVITEDVPTAKKLFPQFEVPKLSEGPQQFLLRHAKHLIISNSSFGWWGAWLNQKVETVICPKFWLRYNQGDYWWPRHVCGKDFLHVDQRGCFSDAKVFL